MDLRAAYAVQLPVRVISELLGVPGDMRGRFKQTIDRIWNTTATAGEAMAATADVYEMLGDLIERKRADPADDMTTAIIAARDAEGGETTLTRPGQLAYVREGRASWSDVVEETLRYAAPVSHMPMRYAVRTSRCRAGE